MSEVVSGNPPASSRRQFLANLALGIAGALGLGALVQRFYQFLSPPAPPEREVEILAAWLDAIPDQGGIVAHLPAGHVAIERNGQTVTAFSAVCSHLGCIVEWQPNAEQAWLCPCHHGRYARDGRVLGGPPPRGLTPIPAAVRDGRVFVKLRVRPQSEWT
jgi:cytochrome b6-f complex iron-sulfur subunit